MSNPDYKPAGSTLASARKKADGLTFRLIAAALAWLTTCGLSPQALVMLHYDYYLGGLIEKIHPATYLAGGFLALQFALGDRKKLIATIRTYPGAILLPLSATALAIYDALFLAVPATTLIDSWVLPAEIFLLCAQLNAREGRILAGFAIAFFTLDAVIGIFEAASNRHLVPIVVANAATGAYLTPTEWRAGALLGHPLSNSYLMGCFILLVAFEPRIKTIFLRLPVLALCSVSMLASGSRAALALLPLTLGAGLAAKMAQALMTGKIARDVLIYVFGAVFALALGAPLLLASGFADRFIARFIVDHGSASARAGAWDMVASLPLFHLMTGIPRVEMIALGARYQIGEGVENFWLAFLLSFGLIGYLIFMPSLLVFCRNLARASNSAAIPVLLYFFACCSTSVSISSKSLMVAILTGLILAGRQTSARIPAPARPFAGWSAPAQRLAQ